MNFEFIEKIWKAEQRNKFKTLSEAGRPFALENDSNISEFPCLRGPLKCKENTAPKKTKSSSPRSEESSSGRDGYRYLCRNCRTTVTTQSRETSVNSKHIHVFPNPQGLLFEIGCFTEADCLALGAPTSEFTWFPNFYWDIVLCPECKTHLGWLYTGEGGYFYGLVLQALVKEKT